MPCCYWLLLLQGRSCLSTQFVMSHTSSSCSVCLPVCLRYSLVCLPRRFPPALLSPETPVSQPPLYAYQAASRSSLREKLTGTCQDHPPPDKRPTLLCWNHCWLSPKPSLTIHFFFERLVLKLLSPVSCLHLGSALTNMTATVSECCGKRGC